MFNVLVGVNICRYLHSIYQAVQLNVVWYFVVSRLDDFTYPMTNHQVQTDRIKQRALLAIRKYLTCE